MKYLAARRLGAIGFKRGGIDDEVRGYSVLDRAPKQTSLRARMWSSAVPTLQQRMQVLPGTCQFSVLGLWDKNTMPYAGTMVYRRCSPSTSI